MATIIIFDIHFTWSISGKMKCIIWLKINVIEAVLVMESSAWCCNDTIILYHWSIRKSAVGAINITESIDNILSPASLIANVYIPPLQGTHYLVGAPPSKL